MHFSEGRPPSLHSVDTAASLPTAGDMRLQLQALLDDKEKQLQQAGTLGQRILAQQMELEERINQISEIESGKIHGLGEDEVESEMRLKLAELAEIMQSWETETEQLWSGFGTKFSGATPSPPSPVTSAVVDADTSLQSTATAGPSAAQSSRRAKNAAHRQNDVEFAFEIGSNLITEVRRLQSLLGERDKALQDMKEEKDDLEKTVNGLRSALRTQESSADKYKEENWNLEVTLQELRSQLSDSQATITRLESEQNRTQRLLNTTRESVDFHKNEAERFSSALEELRTKHETDIAQMRRVNAGLQRDKSDLQATVDGLKSDLAKKGRGGFVGRFGSPVTPNGDRLGPNVVPEAEEDDPFTGGASTRRQLDTSVVFAPSETFYDSSPDPSPSKGSIHLAPNHPSNEIEALKQNLAHAQRQISTLKGTLNREKEMRLEYKRKLGAVMGGGDVTLNGEADEKDEEDVSELPYVQPRLTPLRSRGRAGVVRRSGRTNLAQKLAMASHLKKSTAPPVDEVPEFPEEKAQYLDDEPEEEVEEQSENAEWDDGVSPRPASIDGMDPMFANVLRPSASMSSLPSASSPLRGSLTVPPSNRAAGSQSPSHRNVSTRRMRGGAAYHVGDSRPSSLVGQPGDLAAELGFEDDDVILGRKPVIETADFGCQAGFEDIANPTPIHIAPSVATVEIGIQSQEYKSLTSEIGIQSEFEAESPIAVLPVHVGVSTDPDLHTEVTSVKKPLLVETGITTDTPLRLVTHSTQTQTSPIAKFDLETQTSPTAQTTAIFTSPIESTSQTRRTASSTDPIPIPISVRNAATPRPSLINAIPPQLPLRAQDVFDDDVGERTDTGGETEYEDAAETIAASTPVQSSVDFHSIADPTDDGFDSDSDEKSIIVSRISIYHPPPAVKATEDKSVDAIVLEHTPSLPPKPVVKEMSIQTDEWIPPPSSPMGLYRVGSHTQQFQFISSPTPGASTSGATSASPLAKPTTFRDSVGTFGPGRSRPRTASSFSNEKSPSLEGTEEQPRSRVTSTVSTIVALPPPVDKTRPPTMMLPPPPRVPPPPTVVSERKLSTLSSNGPPARPTSPPPPELIQRATTPTFGGPNSLFASNGRPSIRPYSGSLPQPANVRQQPSNGSFRSAAGPASHSGHFPIPGPPGSPAISSLDAVAAVKEHERRRQISASAGSMMSSHRSASSRRPSVSSSLSSEPHVRVLEPLPRPRPTTPAGVIGAAGESTTDPTIIHAITQTMIGEFLYKYTRKVVGKGHGERRHKRFFWVHPYTKTLYWSSADPGSSNVTESTSKSAYIESVRAVLDPNPMPPGLHQWSVVVSTPQREMKFTAPTKERHDIWFNALKYLLARPTPAPVTSPGNPITPSNLGRTPLSPSAGNPRLLTDDQVQKDMVESPQSGRSGRSGLTVESWNITPRAMGQRSHSQLSNHGPGSVGKRPGTPAAEYLRWGGESPASPSKSGFEHISGPADYDDDEHLEFEMHEHTHEGDEGYEGLENVRACCDGRHDLGTLSKKPHHHHHHHHHQHHQSSSNHAPKTSRGPPTLETNQQPSSRPVSPSAWSFRSGRSRNGSSHSHGDGGGPGLFSWKSGESRFGSKRSTKTRPISPFAEPSGR